MKNRTKAWVTPPFPDKKYRIIYADPPWRFGSRFRSRDDDQKPLNYKTMSTQEIRDLPVGDISLPNSVLFLWTTDAHLEQAMWVIDSWGFEYKTVAFVWNKLRRNPGNWTVKSCELCLLGARGRAHAFLESYSEYQYVPIKRRGHSRKPDEIRRSIRRMFGQSTGPRIELFARERHDGWDAWGDEV